MLDFFTLKPATFGLDISDLSLKIIKFENRRGKLDLASWGEKRMQPGIIETGEIKKEDTLAENIRKAVSEVKGVRLKTKYVVVSLPEEKSFLQVIQMPKMSKEELESSIYYEAENYIPLPIDKVYLDFQVIKPIQDHLDHTDVLINAIPKETIDPYVRSLKKAGLKPKVLEIESQAVIRALVKNSVSFSPLLLIDIGENRTSFIIFSGHSLRFTFSLPLSSKKITQAIADKLGIDFSQAEKIKKNYNLNEKDKDGKSKDVFEAMTPVLVELVNQTKKHIDFYRTHASHEHLLPSETPGEIKKIILCGGGANLKGLDGFLEKQIGMPVEIGNPWINVFPESSAKKRVLSSARSLSFATAIGLALRGAQSDKYD